MGGRNRESKAVRRRTLQIIKKPFFLFLTAVLLFSACGAEGESGAEQSTVQEPAAEGDYVYVMEPAEETFQENGSLSKSNFLVKDGYLYYMEEGIYRTPVAETLDFGKSEKVVSLESLPETDRWIISFTVDREENLYYLTRSYQNERVFPVMHKRTAGGEEAYCVTGTEEVTQNLIPVMAADGEGNLYLLSMESLLRYSPEGRLTGRFPLKEVAAGDESGNITNYLMEMPEGRILLFSQNISDLSNTVYEILEGDTPQLRRIDALSDALSGTAEYRKVYPGLAGPLLIKDRELFRYGFEDGSLERILSLEESAVSASAVESVIQISEKQLLIIKYRGAIGRERELALLTKTPADEVPQRETVLLASLFPSYALELAVAKFNQESSQYKVKIERYGAVSVFEDYEGAAARMDAALTSKDSSPDLLDMSDLDMVKYANAGALEDLYSYMGQDSRVKKEDYLSNLLEGYTFGGKLVCIPKTFSFSGVFVTEEGPLRETDDWTMENLMEIAGQYPEWRLFPGYEGAISFFYGDYMLERFVDLESGECSFDSEDFIRFLEWLKRQDAKEEDREKQLLNGCFIGGYNGYQEGLSQFGEDAVLRGLPSADGRDMFRGQANEAVGIAVNSKQKEGAWEFLQFYLSEGRADDYLVVSYVFPASLSMLEEVEEAVMTPQYKLDMDGKVWLDENGQPREVPRRKVFSHLTGVTTEYYALGRDAADVLREKLGQVDFHPRSELEKYVLSIVEEESALFFKGGKNVEEVTGVIQNRVRLLLQESR